jgi:hypothetical protein
VSRVLSVVGLAPIGRILCLRNRSVGAKDRPRKARWANRDVSPDTFMCRISEDLRDRYTATSIRRDGQAVVLKFSGGDHAVDLVPGIFERIDNRCAVYRIPGENGLRPAPTGTSGGSRLPVSRVVGNCGSCLN